MASCAYCDTGILFGGVNDGQNRFCNENCQAAGHFVSLANQIPPHQLDQMVEDTRHGACPKCNRAGSPVDVYKAHRIWSVLILTSWSSSPELSCKSCATKRQIGSIFFCGTLGWWGFPWGIIGTPIQITRNFAAMAARPKQSSPLLRNHVRVLVGQRLAQQQYSQQQAGVNPPPLPR